MRPAPFYKELAFPESSTNEKSAVDYLIQVKKQVVFYPQLCIKF